MVIVSELVISSDGTRLRVELLNHVIQVITDLTAEMTQFHLINLLLF